MQMHRGAWICGLFALAAVCGVARADEATSADNARLAALRDRFQAGLDGLVEKYSLPGMTAAYALPDGRVVAFASGLADKESGQVMTVDTRMLAGSVGKTFVAATALGLAQDGKLSLDDRIEKWLGREPWFEDLPNHDEITVRHLMMHRSGLADHVYDPRFVTDARKMISELDKDPDRYFTPTELIGYIVKREPLFAVGQGFKYTDTGYIVLGLVIERAGGSPYYEQVQKRFLEPLGLELTGPADRRELANLAAGYLTADNPFGLPERVTTADGKMRYNPAIEWTGGGLVSNPQDLVRWAVALYEGKALAKPYVDELVAAAPGEEEQPKRYGLGVFVTNSQLGTSYGHGGWSPGYLTHVGYYPAQRVAIAVQVNTDAAKEEMLGELMGLIGDVLKTVGVKTGAE